MPINVKIRSVSSGKVLDVPGSSLDPGVQIQQFDDHGGLNQNWALRQAGTQFMFKIQTDTESHFVLDAEGSGRADHTRVIQWPDQDHRNQWWTFEPVPPFGSGRFVIWPGHADDQLVMDVTDGSGDNGAQIQLFRRHGRANQLWQVEATLIEA